MRCLDTLNQPQVNDQGGLTGVEEIGQSANCNSNEVVSNLHEILKEGLCILHFGCYCFQSPCF